MSAFSILTTVTFACVAFLFARNGERVIGRVLGLGFLIARGGMLLLMGSLVEHGLIPLLLGAVMLTLAGVAWWQGRS